MENYVKLKKGNKKGTVIFIHGNSCSTESFKPVFENESIDYNMLSFDFFGCGNSPHSDSIDDYSFSSFYNQTLNIINQIDEPILLVGHSLGGHVAIEIAEKVKDLKGIMIFGAPPIKIPLNFEEAFTPNELMLAYYMEQPGDEMIHNLFTSILFNKDPFQLIVNDFKKCDPKFRTAIAQAIQNPKDFNDEVEILTRLNCNKYILLTNDPNVNANYIIKQNEKMNCKIYEIALSGHFPTLEAPQEFIRILKEVTDEVF